MYTNIFPQALMTDQVISDLSKKSSRANQIKYPEDIQVIIRSDKPQHGSLFISNLQAAQNKEILQKLKIGAILCVSKGQNVKHPSYLIKYSKYVPLEEGENIEISEYLEESIGFIQQKINLTNVLVHCISGVNKSPSFVIAYLMKNRKLTLEDAFNEVKSRRKIIRPSQKIIMQLKQYETLLKEKKSINLGGNSKQKTNAFDRSIRSKSNIIFDNSFRIQDKSMLTENMQNKNAYQTKTANKLKANNSIDDNKSMRSMRSNKSDARNKSQINIEILKPKAHQNPERSFFSKAQVLQRSILSKRDNLNKSFQSVNSNKSSKKSQIAFQEMSDLPQLTMNKKSSSSRQQYAKKVRNIDKKNYEINKKIYQIQDKFEKDSMSNKVILENELTEINEMRNSLVSNYNERKVKISQKSKLEIHDKTMEDKYVQQYIKTMGNQYSLQQNY